MENKIGPTAKTKIRRLVFFIFAALLVFVLTEKLFVDSYKVMTESMLPTIQVGQKIIVNEMLFGRRITSNCNKKDKPEFKRLPGIRHIEPNDIVCFNCPKGLWGRMHFNYDVVYCKRILGTPGDRIGAVDGHYWNDKILKPIGIVDEQEKLRWMHNGVFVWNKTYDLFPESGLGWNIKNWGPLVVPAKGMIIMLNENNRELYRTIIEYETGGELGDIDNYTFCNNYYFAVGDNVVNSNDSRYWGFIPEDFIIGIVAGKRVKLNFEQRH